LCTSLDQFRNSVAVIASHIMSSAKLYDCLIIGGGPAGLSVAQGLSRVHRTCAIFSDSKFRNEGIHASHNILTRDGIHPAEFRKIAREQISSYNTTDFVDTKITEAVNESHDGKKEFELSDGEGQTWRGRTVVFATGCKDIFPAIEGYEQN
jgi:thioredoxin reductase